MSYWREVALITTISLAALFTLRIAAPALTGMARVFVALAVAYVAVLAITAVKSRRPS